MDTNSLLQFVTIRITSSFQPYAFDAQVYRRLSFSHTKVFQGHEHNASWLKYRSYFPFASSLSSSFQNPNRRQTGTWKQQQDECEQTNEPS